MIYLGNILYILKNDEGEIIEKHNIFKNITNETLYNIDVKIIDFDSSKIEPNLYNTVITKDFIKINHNHDESTFYTSSIEEYDEFLNSAYYNEVYYDYHA